ncbi:unnamed protein product, partial [Mesorhabditis belari]|uniref:DnaJ homolog subfamily C member 2 n=1 Tax=Mesorhabditis belari TaxID=2138241 RepID=A0AAF3FLD6_9BILA
MTTGLSLAIYGFKPVPRNFEAAGIFWETRVVRDRLTLGLCTLPVCRVIPDCFGKRSNSDSTLQKDDVGTSEARLDAFDTDDERYEKYLYNLDPNDTKNQDHYKVLGIKKLRYKATMEEIRLAYRQKVLKHHPDKKKHKGIVLTSGEDYFTCITKAYEQIGVSETKRRAFDSIDPKYNDDVPTEKSINADNFFTALAPIFELNSRFSTIQPVPLLGDLESSRADVDDFYAFWFSWTSWREYSYLDEQDKEKGEDRWERREMEKANKVERERRRKEEMKRISNLVHMAHNKDLRIQKFKKEDLEAKEKAKEEKAKLRRERQEAEEQEKKRIKDEADRIKQAEEQKEKEAREEQKRQREALKSAKREQTKRLEALCEKFNYWVDDDKEKLLEMERIGRLNFLLETDELSKLCDELENLKLTNEAARELLTEHENVKNKAKMEMANKASNKENNVKENDVVLWSNEEILLVTKAANLYPAGTIDRWIVIADYVNEHRKDKSNPKKTEKQVIVQTKLIQTGAAKPTASAQNKLGTQLPDEDKWSASEQKALEEALRKHPASDPERWDKIAADVPGRTKKACIKRFKYLAELVKNQKK